MKNTTSLSTSQLLDKTKKFASEIILDFPDSIIYHNIDYARRLNKKIQEISEKENLSTSDTEIAMVIGWLFCTGFEHFEVDFTDNNFDNNISANAIANANLFFEKIGVTDSEITQTIIDGIHNSNVPRTPENEVQKVVADSITADLVCKGDDSVLKKIYQEMILQDMDISKNNWYDVILNMGTKVDLHTTYGKKHIKPKLAEVVEGIRQEQKGLEQKNQIVISKELEISDKEFKKLKKKVKNLKGRDDRAIQTLFRTTSKNHYTLNEMVDKKANIMITVNSIILSLVISGIIGQAKEYDHIIHYLPVAMLALTSISSIIFAILSILPNRTQGTFTEEEIRGKKGNLLYFGNFHEMKQRDYEWGMLQMMNDSDYLYSSMVRDIYYLGQILYSKYSLIRWSLRIFLGGFILSLLAFGIIRSMVHVH